MPTRWQNGPAPRRTKCCFQHDKHMRYTTLRCLSFYMRFLYLLPASFLILACPLVSSAQTTDSLLHRFYLGLGATQGSYRFPDYEMPGTFSPSLTAGIHLSPRLALQVSTANYKYQKEDSYNATYYPYTLPTQPSLMVASTVTSDTHLQVVAFPVLLRFRAHQSRTGQIQLDILSGMTIANTKARNDYLEVSSATQAIYKRIRTEDASTRAYLPLGGALRCKLLPGLDIAAELIGHIPLSFAKKNSLGFNNFYFNPTASAVLYYNFGALLQQTPR